MVKVGDKLQVEIAEIDQRGKLSLIPVVETPAEDAAGSGSGNAASASTGPAADTTPEA